MLKDTMPAPDPDTESLKPFPIMNLAPELRERIYRELLLPDKARVNCATPASKMEIGSTSSLQPAILRASKQVHEEASRVLYKETNWILLTTDLSESNGLLPKFRQMLYPWVSMQHLERFPGTFVLQIGVRDGRSLPRRSKAMILIAQQDIQFFCFEISPFDDIEISLSFNAEAMQNPRTRDILLDCCRDIRGAGKIRMNGLYPFVAYAELLAQMRPIQHIQEFFERADRYRERGDLQRGLGHLLDAADIYRAGWYFLLSFLTRDWFRYLPGANDQRIAELREKLVPFSSGCADCLTKAGTPKKARQFIKKIVYDVLFINMTNQQYSSLHYYTALAFVAEREYFRAAGHFRVFLSFQPGHEGADQHVDAMEACLQTMPQTERCKVEAHLKNVMKPYRHRQPGSARLLEEETPDDHVSILSRR